MMLDDMETILSDIHEFITGERPIESLRSCSRDGALSRHRFIH